MALQISAFPKCFLDEISIHRSMTVFDWIDMATGLDADGLEMYEGFFESLDPAYIDTIGDAIDAASFEMPMLCCSPDFTHPDSDRRKREVEREIEMVGITRRLGGRGAVCRVLSGQRYPEVERAQGIEWVVECIQAVLPAAREHGVILGMENHYKDGKWRYAEFAQATDIYMEIVNTFEGDPNFGVQYDPSNALVAGDDPIELLRIVAPRVVSMHASDRYLAEGASLNDLRNKEGIKGYASILRHGVTGRGLNDYEAIFGLLAENGYRGWVSIEDGMNGMDEMHESLEFLHEITARYFPEDSE